MNNLSRYVSLFATVAIARVTIAQLGVVFPKTMGSPAEATSWIVLILVGFAALAASLSIWKETSGKLSANDFIGVAGLVAGAVVLDLALKRIGVWLAA
jgi:predicted membrane channel-forming protein YqfA (hemolysin III family)